MIADENRLSDRLSALDEELSAWGNLTKEKLFRRLLQLGVADKVALAKTITRVKIKGGKNSTLGDVRKEILTKSLRNSIKKQGGEIEAIAFSFARHGIFLEHGVGRGRPVGSGKASAAAKKWLAPVLQPSVEDLADLLAEKYADIAAGELVINIPGILKTSVKV